MSEERKIILDLLSEGKITIDQAEALLDALEGDGDDGYEPGGEDSDDGYEPGGRGGQTDVANAADAVDDEPDRRDAGVCVDEGAAGGEDRRGQGREGHADALGDVSDRLTKVANEMVEVGQEIPARLNRVFQSVFGSFGIGFGVQAERAFDGEIPENGGLSEVDLRTSNGSLKVAGWDQPGYRVVVRSQVRGAVDRAQAEERLAANIRLVTAGGRLSIDSLDRSLLDSMSVSVHLPRDRPYGVNGITSNGSITLDSLNCNWVKLSASNGRVEVESITTARIDVHTSNGSISASGDLGDAVLKSSNGSITVGLACQLPCGVKVRTGNGSIRIRLPRSPRVAYDVLANASNGSVRSTAEGASVETQRETVGGRTKRVRVYTVTADSRGQVAAVDARAGNGSVTIDNV